MMRVVPSEPTQAMIDAAYHLMDGTEDIITPEMCYKIMISAAVPPCTGCYYLREDTPDTFAGCHGCCREYTDNYRKE